VFQSLAETLFNELDCVNANIHLLSVAGDCFTMCASKGTSDSRYYEGFTLISITSARLPQMMKDRQPIFTDFLNPHKLDVFPRRAVDLGYTGCACVPLLANDEVVGIYSFSSTKPLSQSKQDVAFLLTIGQVLGVLARNMRMAKNSAELQMLEERKRLSAEIHDNVAQLVSAMKLSAESASISLEENDRDGILRSLKHLESICSQTLMLLREKMLLLRSSFTHSGGFIEDIRRSLTSFEDQWQLDTELQVMNIREPVALPIQTELQLLHILHECLSNTLLHANASRIIVVLDGDERHLSMMVQDDGKGFDMQDITLDRLGLRVMRERADSLGGRLIVRSFEGQGTTIWAEIPRPPW
jgi:signal transduction histidine kinase